MKALRLQQPIFRVLSRPYPYAASLLTTNTGTPRARWAHNKTDPKIPSPKPKIPPSTSEIPPSRPKIPSPTPFVPNVKTFLTLIGRGLKQHTSKFPSWEALFTLTSKQLRELGLTDARSRRYLIRWRTRFQQGEYGPGGDFKHVVDGRAELRVVEKDVKPVLRLRWPVNVPPGKEPHEVRGKDLVRPRGYRAKSRGIITGPYALALKSGGAVVSVTEGMWEERRGRKIDGGERRQVMVRSKKRVAERRALRENQGF